MTSSSSNDAENSCEGRGGEQAVKKKKDWLELTLGLGSDHDDTPKLIAIHDGSSSSISASQLSSSSSPQQGQQQEIASGSTFDNIIEDLKNADQSCHGLIWKENHNLCSGHEHDYLPFFPSSSSSSSSSSAFMICKSTPSVLQSHSSAWRNFVIDHSDLGLMSRPVLNVTNHYIQRPHQPGLWFTLRSTINRDGEVLPQIPKPYIRLKDANVTVFMVKTYLVRKLGLSNETEVEISCMGQNLLHSQTIEYVRNGIWLPKLVEFLNSNSALEISQIVHHLMSLDYRRSCFPKNN